MMGGLWDTVKSLILVMNRKHLGRVPQYNISCVSLLPTPFSLDLQFLLQEMLGPVVRLVINMYIRPLDIRQALELNLQLLGDIVRSP